MIYSRAMHASISGRQRSEEGGYDDQRVKWRVVAGVALALASFAATCLVMRLPLPARALAPSSVLAAKLDWLGQANLYIDVVFVGSSYTYRGVEAAQIDRELKQRDLPLKSFNLGAPGTYGFELHHYAMGLRDLPATKRPSLAVLELFPLTAPYVMTVMRDNSLNARTVEYHDASTTINNLTILWASDYPFLRKWEATWSHLLHFGYRFANVGALGALLSSGGDRALSSQLKEQQGFPRAFHGQRAHKQGFNPLAYRRDLQAYTRAFNACRSQGECGKVFEADWAFRLRAARALSTSGVAVAFMVPPVPYPSLLGYRMLCKRPGAPPCIELNSPDAYPELFSSDSRYDLGHLNDHGARALAPILADWLAMLSRTGRAGTAPATP